MYNNHLSHIIKTIKSKLNLLVFAAILCILSGCATTELYKKKLNSWQGRNINAFVRAWGYPDSQMKMPNGNNVYVYKTKETRHFPQYQTGGYTTVQTKDDQTIISQVPSVISGGQTYHYKCTTWVEFNKANKIVNTSFRGNSCVASE